MQWLSKITWSSRDNHATTRHPRCSSAGQLAGSLGTWGSNPLSFNLFLSYCMLILHNCSAVLICIPVLIPDSETNCMHPCTQFASPVPSLHADSCLVTEYPSLRPDRLLDACDLISLNRAAVRMEGKEPGRQTGTGVHTIGLRVGNENRYAYEHCRAINGVLACNR